MLLPPREKPHKPPGVSADREVFLRAWVFSSSSAKSRLFPYREKFIRQPSFLPTFPVQSFLPHGQHSPHPRELAERMAQVLERQEQDRAVAERDEQPVGSEGQGASRRHQAAGQLVAAAAEPASAG